MESILKQGSISDRLVYLSISSILVSMVNALVVNPNQTTVFLALRSNSRRKRHFVPSVPWPRSSVKIDPCHNGFVCGQTIPSSGMPSDVTGVEPSWDFKLLRN